MTRFCDMTFGRAVGFSLAVHAAIFGGALAFAHYGGALRPFEPRAITVSLVGPGTGERRVPRRPAAERERAAPLQEPSVVEEHAAPAEDPAPPPSAVDGKRSDAPEAAPEEGAGDAPATGPASFGYSPEEWGLLRSALERARIYPRFARERGIEGTALVRFKVRPTGEIDRVDIVSSSGAKILDDAAVKTIYRAAPVPYVEGWIEVPMVYRLRRAEAR
jgi:TonB family protein